MCLSHLQGDSVKIPQHENRNISEMCKNFGTKFRLFFRIKLRLSVLLPALLALPSTPK